MSDFLKKEPQSRNRKFEKDNSTRRHTEYLNKSRQSRVITKTLFTYETYSLCLLSLSFETPVIFQTKAQLDFATGCIYFHTYRLRHLGLLYFHRPIYLKLIVKKLCMESHHVLVGT